MTGNELLLTEQPEDYQVFGMWKKQLHLQGARTDVIIIGFVSFRQTLGLLGRDTVVILLFLTLCLLAWPRSEPSKAAQRSQTQRGLRLPAQIPFRQLPSLHRWHQRPACPLVPRGTRRYLHASPSLQGTRNLADIFWWPLNVELHQGENAVGTPVPEIRLSC